MIATSNALRNWLGSVDRVHGCIKSGRRRGRPYSYSTTVIIRCYLLMFLNPRLRQHAALHAFLVQHVIVRRLVGLTVVPHRTTLSRRFKALEQPLKARIWAMGWAFVTSGLVELHVLIADGTLHEAAGPSWAARYQKQGLLPPTLRHIDQAAGWGKSPYRGWVWGYRSHPVVALTADLQPVPLLMDATPADVQDNTILLRQLPWLPDQATALLLDSSYEDHALVQAWQRQDGTGGLARWLLIEPKKRRGQPAAWRQQLEVWRYIAEPDLYQLRGTRIEPFFAHWKAAFDLQRLPLQGQDAIVYLLLAMYAYQLLIWDNCQAGRPIYAYQHLILAQADP
jgi:hypothetical protein